MANPLEKALASIDLAHAHDPNRITVDGVELPYELHYAQKCTSYLDKLSPDASETLQLAIRAQHFRRWEVPRSSYPMTRVGYHAWRGFLKKRQADQASQLCAEAGYGEKDVERIAALIRKEDLKKDEETQVLEDVACLVFLDDQFEEFAREKVEEEKMVDILRKTWAKMGAGGRELALKMELSGRPKELIEKALAG